LYLSFFLILIKGAAHTQHDSPGGSMRRGQRIFRPDNKEDRHTCYIGCNIVWPIRSISCLNFVPFLTQSLTFISNVLCRELGLTYSSCHFSSPYKRIDRRMTDY